MEIRSETDILQLPSVSFFSRGELPPVGGVYFVMATHRPALRYIGKAQNLRVRWSDHHRAPQMQPDYRIHWVQFDTEAARAAVETHLIRTFVPPWNAARSEQIITALTWELWHARLSINVLEHDVRRLNQLWWRMADEISRLNEEVERLKHASGEGRDPT